MFGIKLIIIYILELERSGVVTVAGIYELFRAFRISNNTLFRSNLSLVNHTVQTPESTRVSATETTSNINWNIGDIFSELILPPKVWVPFNTYIFGNMLLGPWISLDG